MSSLSFRAETLDDIPRLIGHLQASGMQNAAGRIIPLQALYQGRIAFLEVRRSDSIGSIKRFFSAAALPALMLTGDDDGEATGPAGWPQADRLMRWARVVMVHATGGEPEHYRAAVSLAEHHHRVVMVETTAQQAIAWTQVARRSPSRPKIVLLLPPDGVHPVAVPPAAMH